MYYLLNDYSEGCHPRLMDALMRTNMESTCGYEEDAYCAEAVELIKNAFSCPDSDVHFLVGGTQVNKAVLAHILRPYEAVIAVTGGHITIHESGAIENSGHQVLHYDSGDGKLKPEQILNALDTYDDEHTVSPGAVYISNATEIGTVYTKAELTTLHDCCKSHGLYLYMDGARLGTGLTSEKTDLTPADIAELTDVFYIGGTKNGALFGEAVVINNDALKPHFRNTMKQQGAMLAKGRLLGIQFAELFRDGLWFELAKNANEKAQRLQNGFKMRGIPLFADSATNQIFPILPNEWIHKLAKQFAFEDWANMDEDHRAVRFVASWATKDAPIDALLTALDEME